MYQITEIQSILLSEEIIFDKSSTIKFLLTDSRKLIEAKTTLFFAIHGERLNGHDYLKELYSRGVRNFVVEENIIEQNFPEANILTVPSAIKALQKLTTHHRKQFNIPVIGITGSNGKTIIKEWCHQLLHNNFNICRSPKSYNSQIGVPLSVWGLNAKHNLGVFEAGISEPGEMESLEKIIQPTIGIFTNIGSAHGANFIREEHKVREKLKLFVRSKVLIYCADHSIVNQSITSLWGKNQLEGTLAPELLSWGTSSLAKVQILSSKKENGSTVVTLGYLKEEVQISIPFVDASSVENAMHLVVLMLHLNISESDINKLLGSLQRIAMRLEQKQGINHCLIINDSYNSDIDSLKIALDFLEQQQNKSNKTLVLSDILQSGVPSVDLYQSVVDLIESSGINRFIGIGTTLGMHKYLFPDEEEDLIVEFYADTKEFLEKNTEADFKEEAILLKGARKFEFEKISQLLEEKAHATVMEINMNAVVHNLQFFNSLLKKDTKIMVMVKAFSYGAGSFEIAKLLEFHRVDYLGVAYADEGVALRKAGIKVPIMVLNPEERSFETIIRYNLEPEIYSLKLLHGFLKILDTISVERKLPVHINIDTGMKRLGFDLSEIDELITVLSQQNKLEIKGIFSHLAASDDKKWDVFTSDQIKKFDVASTKISTALSIEPLRHLANSNGITRFPESHFDMVRLGLGLYGINEQFKSELQPVSTLRSTISQIKIVPKGETIGYGRMGKATKKMTIATVAIGYADGLNRLLSNGNGSMVLHGKKAPIVGNICMDMTMIDVTKVDNVQEGDSVEIFGDEISVHEIAGQIGTISYEVLTSVSERVKRVYFIE